MENLKIDPSMSSHKISIIENAESVCNQFRITHVSTLKVAVARKKTSKKAIWNTQIEGDDADEDDINEQDKVLICPNMVTSKK